MSLSVKGRIETITPKQTFKNISKVELILKTDEDTDYPQFIPIEFVDTPKRKKINLLDGFDIGELVEVKINLRGRKWQKPNTNDIKYFGSVEGWEIDRYSKLTNNDQNPSRNETQNVPNDQTVNDLPF